MSYLQKNNLRYSWEFQTGLDTAKINAKIQMLKLPKSQKEKN